MALSKRAVKITKKSCSCTMPGIWKAVAHNPGALVIFHSPWGCGHVTREMDLGGQYRALSRRYFVSGGYTAPLIISGLKEEHSIFGGEDLLRRCIDASVERHHPAYILIAASCVSGVIGDDTMAVAREAEKKWGIPVMASACGGFLDGDYYTGFYEAGRLLAERFLSKQTTDPDRVTLLGDQGGPSAPDALEIKELLRDLGLKSFSHFPSYSSVEEMEIIPSSAFSLAVGGADHSAVWLRKMGTDLQKRWEVPFFDGGFPVGLAGTTQWLQKLGAFAGREEASQKTADRLNIRLLTALADFAAAVKGMQTLLCIGRSRDFFNPEWVIELFSLTGAPLAGIVLLESLTEEQRGVMERELALQTTTPVFYEAEAEGVLTEADLVLTTHELQDTVPRQLFLPLLTPVGISGTLTLAEKMVRMARRKGGMVYV
ncbi:MAG TPA: nitrogenase component 1 [Patescibacteria group bacterium]|nr:nitrogenase component 1 [Patescibacteria group bacterium]